MIVKSLVRGDALPIKKSKFLVPREITAQKLVHILTGYIPDLKPEQSVFFFVKNNIVGGLDSVEEMYRKHKQDDGFLYLTYTTENTFGR